MRVELRHARRLLIRARTRHLVAAHEAVEERIAQPDARHPRSAVVQNLRRLMQIRIAARGADVRLIVRPRRRHSRARRHRRRLRRLHIRRRALDLREHRILGHATTVARSSSHPRVAPTRPPSPVSLPERHRCRNVRRSRLEQRLLRARHLERGAQIVRSRRRSRRQPRRRVTLGALRPHQPRLRHARERFGAQHAEEGRVDRKAQVVARRDEIRLRRLALRFTIFYRGVM